MITVYYDGKCSLCHKEITYYKKIAPPETFVWVDILEQEDLVTQQGISIVDALKLLHAKDELGHIHIGVDAFLIMWQHLGRWRWLAKLVAMPIIYPATKLFYRLFAQWRFDRLAHCQLQKQKDETI
jgi:predicted DCC family thiol-disulfide oxidoreductase YuxK